MTADEKFMRRAIELAQLGLGKVSPNPLVGCVIVHDGKIIGGGYHQKYGEAHAEVNAVNSVKDKSVLRESAVYVTLEPCSHHGKTPPCSDLLVHHQVTRVVIGNLDPYEKVNGSGVAKLESNRIEVEVGILESECRQMNARFLTSVELKRPYIILKWAQTKDGFIARSNYDSKWISNSKSRQLVHKWRSEENAILVGTNTAKFDDPALTVRDWEGRNPVRLVIDNELKLSQDIKLLDGSAETLVFNKIKEEQGARATFLAYDGSLTGLLSRLHERGIQSLIVEGGSKVLNSFIASELWDEARVFTSNQEFGSGIAAPEIVGKLEEDTMIENDHLEIYRNTH